LKRTIQRLLQDRLAMHVLEGEFRDGDRIVVEVENGELKFVKASGGAREAATAAAVRQSNGSG
jgi:ATP-dependent Clp protease ATP-binding subunit ClpA